MKQLFYYSMIFLTVAVTSCKEDEEDQCCDPTNPECVNYNPCWDVEEPTAEIILRGTIFGPDGFELTPDDTL